MQYRDLGKTGKKASIIGFGAEYLDRKPYERVEEVINRVLEQGINMMDLFMPGSEVRRNIGQALGSRRKQIQIQGAIGSVDLKVQYDISRNLDTCKRFSESLLTQLKTDYIEFGMFFFMDTEEALRQIIDNGIVAYAQELKKQGVIHHIGA
ncbi:MAG: aldo/keto reductase, partial [Clostridiales bacterium]|nr:aldo/keto reductase [Clostridiales bacterium]